MTYPTAIVHTTIALPAQDVYEFVSDPSHFPEWIAFMKSTTKQSDNTWSVVSDLGTLTIEFVPKNDLGVIDHKVKLPDGSLVHNLLRVIPNGDGAEVMFTLFRLDGVTQEEFDKDQKSVATDLAKLKKLLESR